MGFADAVMKRLEEEEAKGESAPVTETVAETTPSAAAETQTTQETAPVETAPAAETPPVQQQTSTPTASEANADRKPSGPLAALKAERASRQAAERELAAMKARLEALERQPRQTAPAAVETPQPASKAEGSPDALIEELLNSGDDLLVKTAHQLKAMSAQNAQLKAAVGEVQSWRQQQTEAEEQAHYDAWSNGFLRDHVPGMPQWMLDSLMATKPKARPMDEHLSSIVLQWHEYLEANPTATANSRATNETTPTKPASPPPPRIAPPSTPPPAASRPKTLKEVYAAMESALA